MLNLEIIPKGPVADALATINKQNRKVHATTSRKRRTRFEWKIPVNGATLQIVRHDSAKDTKGTRASYNCIADPPAYLIGKRALSGNVVHKVGAFQLALFKAGLKAQFPTLSASVLGSITPDDCALQSIRVSVYFKRENETDAFGAFLDLHRHCRVTLDSRERKPRRSRILRKTPPRVLTDPDHRHAFSVEMPFGRTLVYLKREWNEFPDTTSRLDDSDKRVALHAAMRCLLCFEIEVDLRTFWYRDNDGLRLQLPFDFRRWTHRQLPEDPVKHIWDTFLEEIWLRTPLAVEESEVDGSHLNWQLQEVLAAYFTGMNVTRHDRMRGDPKEFEKYHAALLKKAHVDILNPWAINKLNLSKTLGPQLTYESRFKPSEDPGFAPHTLSRENVDDAMRAFANSMKRLAQ